MNAKWAMLILVGSFGGFFFFMGVFCYCEVGCRLAPSITRKGLLYLRPGMTEEQVIKAIGYPLYETFDFVPVPTGQEWRARQKNSSTWIYGAPGPCGGGLEISVGVKDGRVYGVGVENYDFGVYECSSRGCPIFWDEEALRRRLN